MSRSYKAVTPKKHWVYSVDGLMRLYSVNANTVSNWVKEGLTPSDDQKPYLFQGAEVARFHKLRRARTATSLRPGEFKCFTCKSLVFPAIETVSDTRSMHQKHMYAARCPECSAQLRKLSNDADRSLVEDCRNPNTNRRCLHEGGGSDPVGIGISRDSSLVGLYTANDRIIHAWLSYAGQYDIKTVDRHLAAIRYFEGILAGKPFNRLTRDDVAKIRDDMKGRSKSEGPDRLSSSSIKHTVSHLSAFLEWLMKQAGFKNLPQDLQGYLKLPKAVLAAAVPVLKRGYPTLVEAGFLLGKMPARSLADRRARAIFAIAFLGALRADTIISLRIRHVDLNRRLILQDAAQVRAKAGKAIHIRWFPIPDRFGAEITEWIHTLGHLGFEDEDALFPEVAHLKLRPLGLSKRKPVPVMATKHAVSEAFAIACRDQEIKYTPHSAKHCIGAERDERSLTHRQRKAWSENMGHDNEQTTERHYGKLPDEVRFELLEQIGSTARTDPLELSDDDKIALIDGIFEWIRKR